MNYAKTTGGIELAVVYVILEGVPGLPVWVPEKKILLPATHNFI